MTDLALVSFVGIDEYTDLDKLIELDHQEVNYYGAFTAINEWGFLYSETRAKSDDDRYPSYKFIRDAKEKIQLEGLRTSVHLCGSEAIEAFFNKEDYIIKLVEESRVQLNFNINKYEIDELLDLVCRSAVFYANNAHASIIVQVNKSKQEFVNRLIPKIRDNDLKIDLLHDASGGYGKQIDTVLEPYWHAFTGYAGGLKPGNIADVLQKIEDVNKNRQRYYIDMESGIRTDNRLDLEKCKAVMVEVSDFIKKQEKDVG